MQNAYQSATLARPADHPCFRSIRHRPVGNRSVDRWIKGCQFQTNFSQKPFSWRETFFFETRIGVRGWHFRNHFFESEYVSPQKARNRYQLGSLGGMVQDMFLAGWFTIPPTWDINHILKQDPLAIISWILSKIQICNQLRSKGSIPKYSLFQHIFKMRNDS